MADPAPTAASPRLRFRQLPPVPSAGMVAEQIATAWFCGLASPTGRSRGFALLLDLLRTQLRMTWGEIWHEAWLLSPNRRERIDLTTLAKLGSGSAGARSVLVDFGTVEQPNRLRTSDGEEVIEPEPPQRREIWRLRAGLEAPSDCDVLRTLVRSRLFLTCVRWCVQNGAAARPSPEKATVDDAQELGKFLSELIAFSAPGFNPAGPRTAAGVCRAEIDHFDWANLPEEEVERLDPGWRSRGETWQSCHRLRAGSRLMGFLRLTLSRSDSDGEDRRRMRLCDLAVQAEAVRLAEAIAAAKRQASRKSIRESLLDPRRGSDPVRILRDSWCAAAPWIYYEVLDEAAPGADAARTLCLVRPTGGLQFRSAPPVADPEPPGTGRLAMESFEEIDCIPHGTLSWGAQAVQLPDLKPVRDRLAAIGEGRICAIRIREDLGQSTVRLYGLAPESASPSRRDYEDLIAEIRNAQATRKTIADEAIRQMRFHAAHVIKNGFLPLDALIKDKLGLGAYHAVASRLDAIGSAGKAEKWEEFKSSLGKQQFRDLQAPILKDVSREFLNTEKIYGSFGRAMQTAPTLQFLSGMILNRITATYAPSEPGRSPTLFSLVMRAFVLASFTNYAKMSGSDIFGAWRNPDQTIRRARLKWNETEYSIVLNETEMLLGRLKLERDDSERTVTLDWARDEGLEWPGTLPDSAGPAVAHPVIATLAFEEMFYNALRHMKLVGEEAIVHLTTNTEATGMWHFEIANKATDPSDSVQRIQEATSGGVECTRVLLKDYPGFAGIYPAAQDPYLKLSFTLNFEEAARAAGNDNRS